ncbi:hypothetical protein Droror1_Dr00014642 [Drosera rotundifolia]
MQVSGFDPIHLLSFLQIFLGSILSRAGAGRLLGSDMKKGKEEESNAAKPSEREVFELSGPVHLTFVDWRLPEHRRSVAASLVQGVYILERDRQQNRQGTTALASAWWEHFNFQLIQVLVDEADSSTFGAIYQYKQAQYLNVPNPVPSYVVAFRGTITKPDSRARDIKLDLQFVLNGLTRCSRYKAGLQAIEGLVSQVGPSNVWLAGHSLGAAIALQAGKHMAKRGCYVETYLFNPPFSSLPLEKIKDAWLKDGIRYTGSLLTAGLATLVKGISSSTSSITGLATHGPQSNDPFLGLYSWVPNLFVNPADPICLEYVGYFEYRDKMVAMGRGGIERIAAKNSIVSLVSGMMGRDGEAAHLLPSAFVTSNMSPAEDFKKAHGIHQWWSPHPYWHSKVYQLR